MNRRHLSFSSRFNRRATLRLLGGCAALVPLHLVGINERVGSAVRGREYAAGVRSITLTAEGPEDSVTLTILVHVVSGGLNLARAEVTIVLTRPNETPVWMTTHANGYGVAYFTHAANGVGSYSAEVSAISAPGYVYTPDGSATATLALGQPPAAEADTEPAATPEPVSDPAPAPESNPAPVSVEPQSTPFSSIQAAVDAASPGSTVTVPPGVYRETVVIDKPLTLAGESGAIIDGRDHDDGAMVREEWIKIEADNVTIRGFEMRYANSPDQRGGLTNNGRSNVTFENLNLHHANGAALSIGSRHGQTSYARNVRVLNCDLHDNGQLGLHGWASVDSLIENCRIYANNTRGVSTSWEAGAFKVAQTTRLTVRNCEVYANHGPGVWFDIDCVDCVVEGCRIHGNNSIGLHYEISRGGVFRNNLIWANGFGSSGWASGAGIRIANSRDCVVEGNVVAWNADGIAITGQDRTYQDKTFYVITGNQITNNTIAIANPSGGHNVFGLAFVWDRDFLTTSWSHSGNRMWHEHPNTPNSCGGPEGWGPNNEEWFTEFDSGGDWLTRSEMQSRLSAVGLPTSP